MPGRDTHWFFKMQLWSFLSFWVFKQTIIRPHACREGETKKKLHFFKCRIVCLMFELPFLPYFPQSIKLSLPLTSFPVYTFHLHCWPSFFHRSIFWKSDERNGVSPWKDEQTYMGSAGISQCSLLNFFLHPKLDFLVSHPSWVSCRVRLQAGNSRRANVAAVVWRLSVCWQNFLLLRGGQSLFSSADWMSPTHIIEGNPLYSKSTNLNVKSHPNALSQKHLG